MPSAIESFTFEDADPNRRRNTVEPGEEIAASSFLLANNATLTAAHAYGFAMGPDTPAYKDEKRWLDGQEEDKGRNAYVPEPEVIRSHLDTLARVVDRLRRDVDHSKMVITSGLRPPQHNANAGGAFSSRHQAGLAADLVFYTEEGKIPPRKIAQVAKAIGGYPRFERAIFYDSFTHVALPRSPESYDGQTHILRNTKNGAVAIDGRHRPGYDVEHNEQEIDLITSDAVDASKAAMKDQLGVLSANAYSGLPDAEEAQPLAGREAPEEGELDIGDLRFGSIALEAVDESERNQPTALGQQNSGAIGQVDMLRTDMNPILADNSSLPDVAVTISLNATQRDDVNKVLRPLVAMHRRMPFCAVRNRDITRMMLGLGVAEDRTTRLQELYPNLSAEQVESMEDALPQDLAGLWTPVTLQQVSVDTQPGAAGLYQVHVIMRYANVMPYVPTMKFWKQTESAVEWARYLSLRSMQGAEPGPAGEEPGARQVTTPDDKVLSAVPPADMGDGQTNSPFQSYPFKKFYRGLLEEYQPDYYHRIKASIKEDDQTSYSERLRPIGTAEDGDPVYEPAYPIQDPERTFEEFDSTTPLGLQYVTVSDGSTPQARLQRILRAFEEQIDLAERLDAAIEVGQLTADNVRGLEEAGKISPLIMGPGRRLGQIMLSVDQTADAFNKVASDVATTMESGDMTGLMESKVKEYGVDLDGNGRLTEDSYKTSVTEAGASTSEEQRKNLALLRGDLAGHKITESMMRPAEVFNRGGVVDFQVPDRKHEEIFINFEDRVRDLQKGVLATYAHMIEAMGRAERWEVPTDTPDDVIWSSWFDTFINQEIEEYITDREELSMDDIETNTRRIPTGINAEGNQSRDVTYYNGGFDEWVPEGFGSYMLTYKFLDRLLTHTDDWPGSDRSSAGPHTTSPTGGLAVGGAPVEDYNGGIPPVAWKARKDLDELLKASQRFSQETIEAVNGGQSTIEEYYQDRADETYGYLGLENSTVENIHLRFSNRFGQREWDGYPRPVNQHIGGGNAEVTLELTTNNALLLDQIGEMARSQQTVAEQRKTEDAVPPLLSVKGPGNLLRAHGIRRLAYRSHTINMAESKPGYYKVRLELVQDEETLIRTEQFRRVGGTENGRITSTQSVAPLTIPIVGGRSNEFAGFLNDESSGARPAAVYDLLRVAYGDEIEDLYPDRDSFGEALLYSREQYNKGVGDLTYNRGVGTHTLIDIIHNRTITRAEVDYHRPGDRTRENEGVDPNPNGSTFEATVTYKTEDGSRRTTTSDITELLGPLASLMDYASGRLDKRKFRRLVQRVEQSLETQGYRNGLLVSWLRITEARMQEFIQGGSYEIEEQKQNDGSVWAKIAEQNNALAPDDPMSTFGPDLTSTVVVRNDNLTRLFTRITKDGELASPSDNALVPYHIKTFRLAASELASSLLSNQDFYAVYRDWLDDTDRFPGLSRQNTWAQARERRKQTIEQKGKLPSAYTDLLVRPLRDPSQGGVNILGRDFPFGPGTAKLTEDLHMERYEIADQVRQAAAVKTATIGFDTLNEYMGAENHSNHNTEQLKGCFNEAIKDLRKESGGKLRYAPFDLSGGDDYFGKMYENLKSNAAFRGSVSGGIRTEDLVQALQISKTIEYVTTVMEAAAADADAQFTLEKEGRINERITGHVQGVLEKLRQGEPLNFGPADVAGTASTLQNSTSVEANPWLNRQREELLKIYNSDPETLKRFLGYTDRFTEPRRAKLRRKLRDSWTGWEGMRQAFPSYMLVLAGQMGTGLYKTMTDLYSWTAVQQIDIRSMADNAGKQCDLALSNMRKRISASGDFRGATERVGSYATDDTMEVKVGNHMHVYLGYGPDAAHMEPFAGRVTGVNPGPVTQVQLSSYSTTLNNPPNNGQGFFVDGWDGQQSLSEAILYTISQTSGLEGLGRNAPGSALDRLGREARGFAEDDFRSSVMIALYRNFGSPGLSWMMDDEETRNRSGTLLDAVSRHGAGKVKDLILGDPQIYENVWVTASQSSSGYGEMLFGGLADYLTGGKGWGWAALPGETAWAQLKDQSRLFEDYVVTTRPYNGHVPLSRLDRHPLRETLYFGPKTGSYIHSSDEPEATEAFVQLEQEEIEKAIQSVEDEEFDTDIDEDGSLPFRSRTYALYEQLLVEQTVFKEIIQRVQAGETEGPITSLGESFSEVVDTLQSGVSFTSALQSGKLNDFLENHQLGQNRREPIRQQLQQLFPNTSSVLLNLPVTVGSDGGTPLKDAGMGADHMPASAYLKIIRLVRAAGEDEDRGLIEAYNENSERLTTFHIAWESAQRQLLGGTKPDGRRQVFEKVMDAFQKDLVRLAKQPGYYESLGQGDVSENPVVSHIRQKLVDKGFVPSKRMKPVQRHHFGDTYRAVANQNVQATDRHPEFANRLTLSFPTEPDERLAAYTGQHGEQQSYQVQASPTINEDYIVDRQVYFPNLRYNQADVAGLLSAQLEEARAGGPSFEELVNERSDIQDALNDKEQTYTMGIGVTLDGSTVEAGEEIHPDTALQLVSKKINELLGELQPFYTRPKYSVVAANLLKESFSKMYSGDLIMQGDPTIRPYHIIHLWDDVDQMQGPVEVDGVRHRFDSQQGFYSQVEPKLTTYIRGADEGMDTQWLSSAASVTYMMGWANRIGSAFGQLAGLGTRGAMYATVGRMAHSAGMNLLKSGVTSGFSIARNAMRVAGGFFNPLLAIDAALQLAEFAYEGGQEKQKDFIGLVQGAMDANPIMFLPLSYKGEPHTAGLTGSTGPASLTEVAAKEIDEGGVLQGTKTTDIINRMASFYDASGRGPQAQ